MARRSELRASASLAAEEPLGFVDRGGLATVYLGDFGSSGVNRVEISKANPSELLDTLRAQRIDVADRRGNWRTRSHRRGKRLLRDDPALALLRSGRSGELTRAVDKRTECRIPALRLGHQLLELLDEAARRTSRDCGLWDRHSRVD